jgi:phage RecT family recombinase
VSQYEIIRSKITDPNLVKSLSTILGKKRGKEYAVSVLAEVKKSEGTKNDLTKCTPDSIMFCMRDAAKLRISLDGRQHAHIINYGGKATLQIGYRGYLARLQESLTGFAAQVECVYSGEKVNVKRDGFIETVTHERPDCFGQRKDADIIGVYAQISYDAGSARVSHVVTMNRAEIEKIKGCAKDRTFWGNWFSEKAKVAVLRRACKMHFGAVTFDLDAADNSDFDESAAERAAASTSTLIDAVNDTANDSGEMKDVTNA